MMLRRAFFWWQLLAVIALPVLTFLTRGIFGARLGWDVLGAAIAAPVLGFALLVVALLIAVRPSVMRVKAVSWYDLVVLAGWHAAIVWFCLDPAAWLIGAAVLFAMLAFWGAIWQLVTDTTRRVAGAMRDFSVEFTTAVGEQRSGAPIDLGELRPIDGGTGPASGDSAR